MPRAWPFANFRRASGIASSGKVAPTTGVTLPSATYTPVSASARRYSRSVRLPALSMIRSYRRAGGQNPLFPGPRPTVKPGDTVSPPDGVPDTVV